MKRSPTSFSSSPQDNRSAMVTGHRRTGVTLLIGALLLVATSIGAQSAEDLIERNLKARGGLKRLLAVESVALVSETDPRNVFLADRVRQTIAYLTSDSSFAVAQWAGGAYTFRIDGREVTVADSLPGFPDVGTTGFMARYGALGFEVRYAGSVQIDDRFAYVLEFSHATKPAWRVYLDMDTNLELQIEGAVRFRVLKWTRVSGTLWPEQIALVNNDGSTSDPIALRVTLNEPLAHDRFQNAPAATR